MTLVPKHSVRPILVYFEKIRNEKKVLLWGWGKGAAGREATPYGNCHHFFTLPLKYPHKMTITKEEATTARNMSSNLHD